MAYEAEKSALDQTRATPALPELVEALQGVASNAPVKPEISQGRGSVRSDLLAALGLEDSVDTAFSDRVASPFAITEADFKRFDGMED